MRPTASDMRLARATPRRHGALPSSWPRQPARGHGPLPNGPLPSWGGEIARRGGGEGEGEGRGGRG